MKTDLYTKVLLTLITILLGVLATDKIYDIAIPKAEAKTTTVTKTVYEGKCTNTDIIPWEEVGWNPGYNADHNSYLSRNKESTPPKGHIILISMLSKGMDAWGHPRPKTWSKLYNESGNHNLFNHIGIQVCQRQHKQGGSEYSAYRLIIFE